MGIDSVSTDSTYGTNFKVGCRGNWVQTGSGFSGAWVQIDDHGTIRSMYGPYLIRGTGTYYWVGATTGGVYDWLYPMRFGVMSQWGNYWGAWMNASHIFPDCRTLPATGITANSAMLNGEFTIDERRYFQPSFKLKVGEEGTPINIWTTAAWYAPGYALISKYAGFLIPNTLYFFKFVPSFAMTNSDKCEWLRFFTGTQTYEYRAFAMDWEGIVHYGEVKTYDRPL